MAGTWVRKNTGARTIVFVHGVLSSADECWRNKNGAYWPNLLAADVDVEDSSIYDFSYKTGFFSGNYRLGNVVDSIKEHFKLDGVLDCKQLIFVCHSMGGIVARKYFVERISDLIDRRIEVGFFLLASPSLGSEYANWLRPLATLVGHTQAEALRFSEDNAWLMDLDKEFQNTLGSQRINVFGKELIEDNFIVLRGFLRKQVVQSFAAGRYWGDSFKVEDSDHLSISKPQDTNSTQYRLLRQFLLDHPPQHNGSRSTEGSANPQ